MIKNLSNFPGGFALFYILEEVPSIEWSLFYNIDLD